MTTAGSNFISGITTTVFASTDVVNKTYVDVNVPTFPSQTGNAGKFLTTTDGTNLSWDYVSNSQEFTATGAQTFNVPSYSNLLFIEAVGAGGGGSAGQTTAQAAVTWTLRTTSGTILDIVYANDTFIACGSNGLITSTNAITWTLRTVFVGVGLYGITYGNNLYVAGGSTNVLVTSTDTISWTLRTINLSVTFNGLTFGSTPTNTYLACGAGVNVSSSTDAIVWTLRTAGSPTSVKFANGLYFVLGGAVLNTSTDAISWTQRTSGIISGINSLTFANNTYVAISSGGTVIVSTNAIQWTLRTSGTTDTLRDLTFGDNTYVVTGGAGVSSPPLITSTDTITWTLRTSGLNTAVIFYAITYGNTTYVAIGDRTVTSYLQASGAGGGAGSYTSWYIPKSIVSSNLTVNPGVGGAGATTDAAAGSAGAGTTISWTGPGGTYTITASGGSGTAAGAAQLVSQSSSFYTTAGLSGASQSPIGSGITATSQTNQFQPTGGGSGAGSTSSPGGSGGAINVYGITTSASGGTSNGTDGTNAVAISGLPYGYGGGGGGARIESLPWYWILRTSGFGLNPISDVHYGNNVYLISGDGGRLFTSTNTISWTSRTSAFGTTKINTITYGNNLYLIGGTFKIGSSTDSISWTLRTATSIIYTPVKVEFGNNIYLAGDANGGLITSTDTINWTARTASLGASSNFINSISYQNGYYFIGSQSAKLSVSTDAINWTLRTTGFNPSPSLSGAGGLVYGTVYGNKLYLTASRGTLSASTDTINWSIRTIGTLDSYRLEASKPQYRNGNYIFGGPSAGIIKSTDSIVWTFGTTQASGIITAFAYGDVNNDIVHAGSSFSDSQLAVLSLSCGIGGNGARGGGGGGGASIGSTFSNGGNGGDGYVKISWW